jgi:hypothetical protein
VAFSAVAAAAIVSQQFPYRPARAEIDFDLVPLLPFALAPFTFCALVSLSHSGFQRCIHSCTSRLSFKGTVTYLP